MTKGFGEVSLLQERDENSCQRIKSSFRECKVEMEAGDEDRRKMGCKIQERDS